MPTDRYNANNGRPLMPTLASNRTVKSPITPRLAASATPTNTPQPRRPERSDTGSTPKANTGAREDLSTPVKAFLSSNITPRSSSRKSRVGTNSTQSTPNGTPSGTPSSARPASTIDMLNIRDQGTGFGGMGINGLYGASNTGRPKSLVNGGGGYQNVPFTRSPMSNGYGTIGSDAGGPRDISPMFFHALDSRSQEPSTVQKTSPAFVYANGEDENPPRSEGIPSPPLSIVDRTRSQSKFFYADSTPEVKTHSPLLTPPLVTPSLEPMLSPNPSQKPSALRPPSPSKDNIHLSYRKGASQVIRPNIHQRPSALSILPGHSHSHAAQSHVQDFDHERSSHRRSSVGSSTSRINHAKSASLSSIDSVNSATKAFQAHTETLASIHSPLHKENGIVSNGSIPESAASNSTPPKEDLQSFPLSLPQSPAKSSGGQSALQHMNELAANARRERKVLDLEISNSSLLAINRQLERQVRKQKAELQRFRRLSRAGRFSLGTQRSSMGELSTIGDSEFGDLSDIVQEDEEPDEDDEPEESSSESSVDEETLSPDALADRDASYRLRDEKRLQLDLTKHRELLVDSQKMNQSLKRCLGWTEELINDGKKALEYKVHVSDVKLGGRVLSSEEEFTVGAGVEFGHGGTLLSAWTLPDRTSDPSKHASLGSERTDRDSGVELEGLKQLQAQEQDQEQDLDMSTASSDMGDTLSRPPRLTDILGETF